MIDRLTKLGRTLLGSRAVQATIDAMYPTSIKCIVCDEELIDNNRYGLCANCTLIKNTKFCTVCGQHIDDIAPVCEGCKSSMHMYKMARTALVYKDDVINVVRKYKFGHGKYLATILSEFMIDTYYELGLSADIMTYVPLHISKLKSRGYNQAQLLAICVGRAIGLKPINTLVKIVQPSDTARLGKEQRAEVVKGTFAFDETSRDIIKGRAILLIDDVYTTGATANECSRLLLSGGAKSITVLTLASPVAKKLSLD